MKNKIFLFVILVQLVSVVLAQSLPSVERVEKLDMEGFNARFSPSGETLLLTDAHFKGLKLYDLKTKKLRTDLSMENANGYGAVLTDDEVVFEKSSVDGFYSLDLNSKETKSVTTRNLRKIDTHSARVAGDFVVDVQESADLREIILTFSSGKKTAIAPLGSQDYLNVSFSPDYKKILFRVSGHGSYISSLEGEILVNLGNVEFPQWFDQETVIYTVTKDDGYTFVSSDVYVANWLTGQSSKLQLPKSLIPIYPSVDGVHQKLVFNTPKGDLYLVTMQD